MNNSALKTKYIDKARFMFGHNLIEGYSKWKKTHYRFIAPAKKEYVYQFLWDTAFHAIVLSHFDPSWAKEEIKNHLLGQWDDGFIPHIIFWKAGTFNLPHWAFIESKLSLRPYTSAITQPPLLGVAIEQVFKKDPDKEFLKEVLPKVARHYKWLVENRDPDQDHLVSIISPNESGMDELPVFQVVSGFAGRNLVQLHYAYRKPDILNQIYGFNSKKILEKDYFNVEEVLFNTVFIENSYAMSRLFKKLDNKKEADYFRKAANKCEQALLKKCWDTRDGLFYSLFSKNEHMAKIKTAASLIPLFLANLPNDKLDTLINRHLLNPKEFWTKYPVPTVAQNEHYYSPHEFPRYQHRLRGRILNKIYLGFYGELKMLWRGPTWMATNWFIVKGLQKHGRHDIADIIILKMIEMIDKWGFREYYNPETGEGYRRQNFGWSTLIVDLL